jgi:autotransporter-associated beta strand protein
MNCAAESCAWRKKKIRRLASSDFKFDMHEGCMIDNLAAHSAPLIVMKLPPTIIPLIGSIALVLPASGAQIKKANNASDLNTAPSWVNAAVPGTGDVAVWDATVTAPNSALLGGDTGWMGILVSDVGGARNGTNNITIANAGSVNTLTLGASGIDMSAATQALVIQAKLALAANQTWNIANANTATGIAGLNVGEDLSIIAQAAATPVNLGGFTVTKTGAGVAALSSGHTISNGAFVVNEGIIHFQGGASRATTIANNVTFTVNNGGTVAFACQSGGITVGAPITLNTGGALNLIPSQGTTITLNGNVNVAGNAMLNVLPQINNAQNAAAQVTLNGSLTGGGNLAYNNTLSTVVNFLRLAGDNSGFTGRLTMGAAAGARVLRLQNANAGSASATWVINDANTLEVDGVSVQLGTLNGNGIVTNSSAVNSATLNIGAGTFTGTIADGGMPMRVTKIGTGTAALLGPNSFTGPTTVSGGTLLFGAATFGATDVTVADGAAFGVRLLNSGETLTVPSVTVGSATGGTLTFDLGSFGNPVAAPMTVGTLATVAPTIIKVTGTGLVPGTFPLLDYAAPIGGLGFNGFTLRLPPRVTGNLVNNAGNTSVDLAITGQDFPKWTGALNGNWDIDDGAGSGTMNWKEITSGNVTGYLETANGADAVLFDDSATGTTTVNLTRALAPRAVTVNASLLDYVFEAVGKLTGGMTLTKTGTKKLIIRNTGGNDFTGLTRIQQGTLEIGDGVTAGAGALGSGDIVNDATLVLNRPDDFTINGVITGAGGIVKNTGATVSFANSVSLNGPLAIGNGALRFNAGGTLLGAISGPGALAVGGGTLQVGGPDANTFAGGVIVSAGVLQLNKDGGATAVSGTVAINGTGQLQLLQPNQIADSANIDFNSDGPNTIVGNETIANATISPGGAGQLIANTGFVIADTLTINGRIFSVASNNSATVHKINLNGGTLRIAANTGPSTLDSGAGGITATGGVIELGQGTGTFDAVWNLGGDFTATANLEINRGGFTGLEKREMNLGGAARTFTIAANTTTNVRPEIAGAGGLIKAGAGTLNLLGVPSYLGDTTVAAGSLRTTTAQTGTANVVVGDNANLVVGISPLNPTLPTGTLTLGASSGGRIEFDIGTSGNPLAPMVNAGSLTTHGANTLALTGAPVPGTFPLIDYTGAIGGSGFAGLTLTLPLRVAGSLVNNAANSSVDVTILGTDTPKWQGNVNANWDVDDGTGTGTANWKGAFSGTSTRYLQGSLGTDSVVFDDSATGAMNVNLTTSLTPRDVRVNNSTRNYVFEGTGKIGGTGGLTKEGSGSLTLKNTTPNDYTGPTTITGGTLQLGDGVTPGAGVIGSGAITNDATLALNHPDDFTLGNVISGSGTIVKNNGNVVTLSAAPTGFFGTMMINAGTLRFSGGGAFNGIVAGAGGIDVPAGTFELGGIDPNTLTGATAITGGTLRLNKAFGVSAISGNVTISGGGVLTILSSEQIPDNATITFLGTSADSTANSVGTETVANVIVNPVVNTGQFLLGNGFTITNTATVQNGILGVRSNQNATINAINMSPGGTLRIAGNGGPSVLDVGAGGITASGGVIEVKFNTNDQSAQLRLGGDFTTTGNVAVTNANYAGASLNQIELIGTRTFNIGDGTTTTVQPDIAGEGNLVKTGNGTLALEALSDGTYTGTTTVNGGTLLVRGSITGSSNVTVNAGGTLRGPGTINAPTTIAGKHAPGDVAGVQTFTNDLTYASGGALVWELLANDDVSSGIAFDRVDAQGSTLTIQPGAQLELTFNTSGSTVRFSDAFWNANHQWTLIDFLGLGTSAGNFGGVALTSDSVGAALAALHPEAFFASSNAGGDIILTYTIPEPASFAFVGAGALLLLRLRGGRQRSRRITPPPTC